MGNQKYNSVLLRIPNFTTSLFGIGKSASRDPPMSNLYLLFPKNSCLKLTGPIKRERFGGVIVWNSRELYFYRHQGFSFRPAWKWKLQTFCLSSKLDAAWTFLLPDGRFMLLPPSLQQCYRGGQSHGTAKKGRKKIKEKLKLGFSFEKNSKFKQEKLVLRSNTTVRMDWGMAGGSTWSGLCHVAAATWTLWFV